MVFQMNLGTRISVVFVLLGVIAGGIATLSGREIMALRSQIDAVPALLGVRVSLADWQSQTAVNAARTVAILQSDDAALNTKLAPAMKATSAGISEVQKRIE